MQRINVVLLFYSETWYCSSQV